MGNLFKDDARPVAHSFIGSVLFEVVRTGVPTILTWYAAHQAAIRGWALPWIILLGSGVFLAISVGIHYVFSLRSNASASDRLIDGPIPNESSALRSELAEALAETQTVREQLAGKKQQLKSTERERDRYQKDAEESKDVNVCLDTWLHNIASFDAENIAEVVITLEVELLSKTSEASPYINFNFYVLNMSVFTVCVSELKDSWIEFSGIRLGGNVRMTENNATRCSHGQGGWFVIRQWLSKEEVEMIQGASDGCVFSFDHVDVRIKGNDKFREDRAVMERRLKLPWTIERSGRKHAASG